MEQRRTKRFTLQLPLSVIRAGAQRVTVPGVTRNISSAGVLFTPDGETELGGPIEYVISLNHDSQHAVNLRCVGKVVRAERTENGRVTREVAATLERYEFVRQ